MTLDEYILDQKRRLFQIRTKNLPLARAAADTNAMQVKRIFTDGGKTSGGKIGSYNSTTALYISPKLAPQSFPTKGKTGKTRFKNGKAHKTGFFDSYKAFRQSQGRESGFVNLNLFGNEQSDLANSLTQQNPQTWTSGFKRSENADKKKGQEKKYGKIFALTKKEQESFLKILELETIKILDA